MVEGFPFKWRGGGWGRDAVSGPGKILVIPDKGPVNPPQGESGQDAHLRKDAACSHASRKERDTQPKNRAC